MDGVARSDLFCEDGFHPAPALYARVADRLADRILELVRPAGANPFVTETS
jgi:lysophospholipase L1-like esterase